MKATEILEWICKESIEGELLNIVDVPECEGGEQNEEWWVNMFGACPPYSIAAGKYLYYYDSSHAYAIEINGRCFEPDAQIEIPCCDGFDYIYLYKLEG